MNARSRKRASTWIAAAFVAAACGNAAKHGTSPGGSGGRAGKGAAGATATAGAGHAGASIGGGADGPSGGAGANEGGAGDTVSTGGRAGSSARGEAGSGAAGETSEGGAAGARDLGALGSLIEAFCGAARACCSADVTRVALRDCEDAFLAQSDNVTLVAGGKAEVDEHALARCVAAYDKAQSSCAQDEVFVACHGILVGTVPDDGPCTDVLECDRSAGPKVCLKIQGSDSHLGTCKTPPRGESGDPCAQSCEIGSYCSSTTSSPDASVPITLCYEEDGLYCPLGESCAPIVHHGSDCIWDEACGSDGFCDSTCAPLGSSGDPCQFTFGCDAGLACINGQCSPEPFANSEACAGYPPSFD